MPHLQQVHGVSSVRPWNTSIDMPKHDWWYHTLHSSHATEGFCLFHKTAFPHSPQGNFGGRGPGFVSMSPEVNSAMRCMARAPLEVLITEYVVCINVWIGDVSSVCAQPHERCDVTTRWPCMCCVTAYLWARYLWVECRFAQSIWILTNNQINDMRKTRNPAELLKTSMGCLGCLHMMRWLPVAMLENEYFSTQSSALLRYFHVFQSFLSAACMFFTALLIYWPKSGVQSYLNIPKSPKIMGEKFQHV